MLISGSRVKSEIGVARVTGVVPFRELNIDLVLGVDPDASFWTVGEKSQHRGFVHVVGMAFDLPLVRAEANSVRRKQL